MCAFHQARVPLPEVNGARREPGFEETLLPYSEQAAVLEAERCLQCAMPYCAQSCPLTQDCRRLVDLMAHRRFAEAARQVLRHNPLSCVVCKTCYHYCEEDCPKGEKGEPIAIRHLERTALEFVEPDLTYVPRPPNGDRVAVVGAGPSGLMAAWDLALRGYSVDLYDGEADPGGLIQSIPRFQLPQDELEKDLRRFRGLDIHFDGGKHSGSDLSPEGLLDQGYAAVFVAVGSSRVRVLTIPGVDLPGVYYAVPFLTAMNRAPGGSLAYSMAFSAAQKGPPRSDPFGRRGRRVVVIGGGDAALDAARTARRLSFAGGVTVVYRRKERDMPSSPEAKKDAEREGIAFLFQRAPVEIVGNGRVEGLVVWPTNATSPNGRGRLAPSPRSLVATTLPCDTIIIAIGAEPDTSAGIPGSQTGVPRNRRTGAARYRFMTLTDGVFASGGSSVVHAMRAGAEAADSIDAYVAQKRGRGPTPRPDPFGDPFPPGVPEGYREPTWHL